MSPVVLVPFLSHLFPIKYVPVLLTHTETYGLVSINHLVVNILNLFFITDYVLSFTKFHKFGGLNSAEIIMINSIVLASDKNYFDLIMVVHQWGAWDAFIYPEKPTKNIKNSNVQIISPVKVG